MNTLYGLVLAGGQSMRMGRDKGALVFHGTDQTHHLATLLAPYVQEVFVSVRSQQLGAAHLVGLQAIEDCYPAPTPLNGIVSAMRFKPDASWLVIAVDMPNITCESIATLIAQRGATAIATCFESPAKGGPDPLFAIWEGHGFAALEALIANTHDHLCPRNLLKTLPARILQGAVAPHVLDNVNTPQELASLQGVDA
jgi:molybdopterin-guanine dinucleotide biosynthesis protein A